MWANSAVETICFHLSLRNDYDFVSVWFFHFVTSFQFVEGPPRVVCLVDVDISFRILCSFFESWVIELSPSRYLFFFPSLVFQEGGGTVFYGLLIRVIQDLRSVDWNPQSPHDALRNSCAFRCTCGTTSSSCYFIYFFILSLFFVNFNVINRNSGGRPVEQ